MRKAFWIASSCLMPLAWGSQAHAQAVPASGPGAPSAQAGQGEQPTHGLEEIVVTAQRRSENLQNVPIAVSAAPAATLQKLNVRGVEDLTRVVPSLKISNSSGFLSTSLRGLGSAATAPGFENPLAIYVDGVYMASQQGSFLDLANISQIEVLKGPQGTLFGRNATAGLLQITTKEPDQTFHADFNLTYGNYKTVEGTGYISGGITQNLAADLSVYGLHQGDGYGKNLTTGKDTYQIPRNILVRSKWVFTPSAATKITLIGDYGNSYDTNVITAPLPGTIDGYEPQAGRQPDRGYDSVADSPAFRKGWNAGGSLKIQQEVGPLELISTTAYRKSHYYEAFDYDFLAGHYADLNWVTPEKQLSQELEIQPKHSGKLKWVAGLYYFDYTGGYAPFHLNLYSADTILTIRNSQNSNSIAGYAQASYEILPKTNLTLGGRYTTEERKAFGGETDVFVPSIGITVASIPAEDMSKRFNKFTFRASLDHRFSRDVLAYASFNRGFKSGGFNTGSPGTEPYEPETVDAYEGGLKTNLIGNSLRLNLAGFYYRYSNVQASRLAGGVIEIVNAASARIYGADMDFDAKLSDRFRVSGGFTYSNAKYTSYPNGLQAVPGEPSIFPADLSGRYLPLASKYVVSLLVDYTAPLSGGSLEVTPSLYFNSGYSVESDNFYQEPAYVQLGGTLRWTAPNGRYSVSAWAKNITNKRVFVYGQTIATNGTMSSLFGPPRTYGVSVGYKF